MTHINYQEDRKGFTVLPDLVDDATGLRIPDTGMIADTRHAAFAREDQPDLADPETEYDEHITYITEEEAEELGVLDELTPEVSTVELSDITTEVLEHSSTYDEAQASAVLEAPLDNSPGDVTIAYLAHQYYSGNLSAQEAYDEALNSGIPPEALAVSYRKLQSYFQ